MEVVWLLLVLGGVAAWMMSGYNHLQALSQRIGESRSNIENSLATRSDLITQLFEIAKENGVHEAQIHTAVAQLESHPGGLAGAGFEGLMNVMTPINRAYPDLKASEGYKTLMEQLRQVEEMILSRRDRYNAVVREYNTAINSLPTLLYARPVGFSEAPYYDNKNPETLALFQAASGEKMREAIFSVSKAIAEKSSQVGESLIDESRQISVKTASTVVARGRGIAEYGRKKLGRGPADGEPGVDESVAIQAEAAEDEAHGRSGATEPREDHKADAAEENVPAGEHRKADA
jgi:LemA protein